MKIVYFGSDYFAQAVLDELVSSVHDICAVVTTPDAAKGRGRRFARSAVKEYAIDKHLPCLEPSDLKEENFLTKIRAYQADIFIVVSYGKILPRLLLDVPKKYTINIHPSLLPKYRGPAPINHCLLNADTVTGISVITLNEAIDAGAVIYQEKVAIDKEINSEELTELLARRARNCIGSVLEAISEDRVSPIGQNEDEHTYAPRMHKEDGRITWQESADEIHNKVRAYVPWPSAFTDFKGKRLKILRTRVSDCPPDGGEPGSIVSIHKGGWITIQCAKGCIEVHEVQYEGKKRMNAYEWAKGQRLSEGDTCA